MLLAWIVGSLLGSPAPTEDWPDWRGPDRDGVWKETGLIEKFPSEVIERRWSAPIGPGYSGPTVAGGQVYVTDRLRDPKSIERVHCFNEANGESIWTHKYDCEYRGVGYEAGPRASVVIHDGIAYSLGSMGHLFALKTTDGEVVWCHDLNEEYKIRMPIWGISATPIIEDDLLIVVVGGEGRSCMVAFDHRTGEEQWRALPDRANYSSPVIVEQAGERVLVCWTGDRVVGLDPQSGDVHWAVDHQPKQMPLGISTPIIADDHIYLTGFYDGSLLLRMKSDALEVEEVWRRRGPNERRTDSLHSIISTPVVLDGYIYGVDSYGEFRCLDLLTGDRVWEDDTAVPRSRWATIHFVQNDDLTWMFNERGELIIAFLTPDGYEELSRAKLLDPTLEQLNRRDGVCWSHPAFANRHVFARNDKELVCADLSKK